MKLIMLKGLHITAFALTLTSFFVGISTKIAYSQEITEHQVFVNIEPKESPSEGKCTPTKWKPCPIKGTGGNTDPSPFDKTTPTTPGEVNDVTSTVESKKLKL